MPKRPDYRVAAMNKDTEAKGNIGAAWINENGTISVTIEPFIHIQGGKEMLITLFPNKD